MSFEEIFKPDEAAERKRAKGLTHPDTLAHPVKKDDGSEPDTTHVIIQDETTIRSDLEYLASKLGVSLDQLQAERLENEKRGRQDEINRRLEKKRRAREAQEAALEREFLTNYGGKDGHYLMTVGGKRIQKLKDFSEITCPHCGVPMPTVRGLGQAIAEWRNNSFDITGNPLSAWFGLPARGEDVKCKNGHKVRVVVQYII
jgi:hypothetical protein